MKNNPFLTTRMSLADPLFAASCDDDHAEYPASSVGLLQPLTEAWCELGECFFTREYQVPQFYPIGKYISFSERAENSD
jgi:hypothetical protein